MGSGRRSCRCRVGNCLLDRARAYRAQVLGSAPRVAVEAAVAQGWERWLGEAGSFIGMIGVWRLGAGSQAV